MKRKHNNPHPLNTVKRFLFETEQFFGWLVVKRMQKEVKIVKGKSFISIEL